MGYRVKSLGLLIGLGLLAAACSSSGTTTSVDDTEWRLEELDTGDDYFGATAAPGPDGAAVIVTRSLAPQFQSPEIEGWLQSPDGLTRATFQGVPVTSDATRSEGAVVLAPVPDGFLVAAVEPVTFLPEFWASADGINWSRVATTGLDAPFEPRSVLSTDSATYLVGAKRVNRLEGVSPLSPAIWRTTDRQEWTLTDLAARGIGVVNSIEMTDAGLLAFGRDADGAQIWQSTDDGISWQPGPTPSFGVASENWEILDTASVDDTLIAVGEISSFDKTGEGLRPSNASIRELLILTSVDGGVTWQQTTPGSENLAGLRYADQASVAAGAFWVVAQRTLEPGTYPAACYTDIESCRQLERPVLLRSDDGIEWTEIGLLGRQQQAAMDIAGVIDTGDGVNVIALGDAVQTWRWASTSAPPERIYSDLRSENAYITPDWQDQLEIGVTYRFPQGTHCGVNRLANFNGRWWYANGPDGEGPGLRPSWPTADETLFGYVTLIDADTIEYSIDSGEVIIAYEASDEAPFALCE